MPKSKHNRKHSASPFFKKAVKRINKRRAQAATVLIEHAKEAATPDRERGIYPKYMISRLDGSSEPGKKHEKCRYFVLDLDHDPHATPALFSYATSARADGYEQLAGELFAQIQPYLQRLEDHAKQLLLDDIDQLPEIEAMDGQQLTDAVASEVVDLLPANGRAALLLEQLIVRYADQVKPKKRASRKKSVELVDTDAKAKRNGKAEKQDA
jgi:hypothetical protein